MKEYIEKAALLETFDKWIDLGIYSVAELNVMRHARRIVRNAPVCELPDREDEWIRNPDVTDADLKAAWGRVKDAPVCEFPNSPVCEFPNSPVREFPNSPVCEFPKNGEEEE